jgi:RNA polymerase sigma-70 factor, ECF subfamily
LESFQTVIGRPLICFASNESPIKKRQRGRKSQYDAPESIENITEEMTDRKEQSESLIVREAIDLLPDDARLVLTLRFFEDMSCTEIAEHLDEPLGTVTSRLHRAYQILKEKLL